MEPQTLPKPTDAELAILQVLWRCGPSTVRHVHDELAQSRGTGYTTVLKLLQIMGDKGLVNRDESQRAHVYQASISEERTQSQLVGDLLDKAFSGSASSLVMQALSSRPASRQELDEIRRLVAGLDGEEG